MAGSTLKLEPDAYSGRRLGKYEILCRLSMGGMSEIFLASQRGLAGFRKFVVLKQILPDIRGEEEFVRMFLDEARITAAFAHPNIAQVFDLDIADGELFLAMEFVPGATLVEVARACRSNNEPIPIGLTLMAVRDTALALHYAHTFVDPSGRPQQVIHRDIAEKNIMVTYEGTTKLLDFGIAKALNRSARTNVGMVKGTTGYMSPEQIMGEPLDPRSDIFSLGVVLHECLTGMRLFHGKKPEDGMMMALKGEVAPPSKQNPAIPPELDQVALKALQRQRNDRYATALEMARALDRAVPQHIWHPEESGPLMQRLFADRREQTRQLMFQAQSETTGEFTLANFFRTSGPPVPEPPPPAPPPRPAPVPARRAQTVAAVPSVPVSRIPTPSVVELTPLPSGAGDEGLLKETTQPEFDAPDLPFESYDSEPLTVPAKSLKALQERGKVPPPNPPSKLRPPEHETTAPGEAPGLPSDDTGEQTVLVDDVAALMAEQPSAEVPIREEVEPEPESESDLESDTRADDEPALEAPDTAPSHRASHRRSNARKVVVLLAGAALVGAIVALLRHSSTTEPAEEPTKVTAEPIRKVDRGEPEKNAPEKAHPAPSPSPEKTAHEQAEPTHATEPEQAPDPDGAKEGDKAHSQSIHLVPANATKKVVVPLKKESPPKPPKTVVKHHTTETTGTDPTRSAADQAWDNPGAETAQAPVSGKGQLTLVTEPWSNVFLGGDALGQTPLIKVELPAGSHTLRLVGGDQKAFALPVKIEPGKETKVRIPLSTLKAL